MLVFITYPKCSTCRKAANWLKENQIPFKKRHIINDKLNANEIKELHTKSGLPIEKFFNINGTKYRELGLKDKIANMTDEECYDILATDGMLVKRPLVCHEDGSVTLGFKVDEYVENWK